jgi:hypothetical protein
MEIQIVGATGASVATLSIVGIHACIVASQSSGNAASALRQTDMECPQPPALPCPGRAVVE